MTVLARMDEEGRIGYLETATARNVLLYERLGFAVVEELTLPGTDVHGWLMLRRPRRPSWERHCLVMISAAYDASSP